MPRLRRVERIAALTKMLTSRPHELIPLSYFCAYFDIAKSTLSEDLVSIRKSFETFSLGEIETVYGAAGGVRYLPYRRGREAEEVLARMAETLADENRILAGGFLYMSDVLYNWSWMTAVGEIFMTRFCNARPDCIMTVETKGILPAMMVARAFNRPLVVARRDSRVTEGSSIGINYVSGSTKRVQTMSLAKRALSAGQRVLVIDDFMKAGGTVKGLMQLVHELGAETVGVGVLVATAKPAHKLVDEYTPLLILHGMEDGAEHPYVEPQPEQMKGE